MSESDCILADRGQGGDSSRALAACSDSEAGRRILANDLIHPDMAPQRPTVREVRLDDSDDIWRSEPRRH
jgi:hypothetical protein